MIVRSVRAKLSVAHWEWERKGMGSLRECQLKIYSRSWHISTTLTQLYGAVSTNNCQPTYTTGSTVNYE